MDTETRLDLLEEKTLTAETLLASVRRACQQDQPDWHDAIDAADKATQTSGSLLRSIVEGARDHGVTWEQIGSRLGISRQAAHERFSG